MSSNQLKVAQQLMEMELCPLSYILNRTLDLLFARDTDALFHDPVDVDEVSINFTIPSMLLRGIIV